MLKNIFKENWGFISFEYLILYSFILICFLLIISLQIYTLFRTFAVYDLLRVIRLESMEEDSLYADINLEEIKNRYEFEKQFFKSVIENRKIYIGTLYEYTFNNTSFLKLKKIVEVDFPYQKYTLETSQQILPFLNIDPNEIYLIEPKKPKDQLEHINLEDENRSCNLINLTGYKQYEDYQKKCP